MQEKIKDFLYGVGGIGFFVLIIISFALLIIGGAKLFELIYPILEKISIFTWSVVWLLVILSIVPRFRYFTGIGIILGTYIGGAIFWFLCFYVTYSLLGLLGILIGVLFFGLGVIPVSILALLFSKQFTLALVFIFTSLQILLLRFLGVWIVTKYKSSDKLTSKENTDNKKVYIAVPAEKLLKKPLSLGIVFVIIFLFFEGIGELFYFYRQPFPNFHIIWAVLSIIGAIGLLLQTLWGYRATQAMMIINIVTTPFYFLFPDVSFPGKIGALIFIGISGLILWYLSIKNIKEQFLPGVFIEENTEDNKVQLNQNRENNELL